MKGITIGVTKARLVDDRGVVFTAVKEGNVWIFEGIAYENPFKAFMSLERSLNKWRRQ